MFTIKQKLTINDLDQLQCWSLVIGKYVSIGEKFNSPFRSESKSKTSNLTDHQGYISYSSFNPKDRDYLGWNCVKAYAYISGLSYNRALEVLHKNHATGVFKPRTERKRVISTLTPFIIDMSSEGLEYWFKRGVKDLSNIYQIEGFHTGDYQVYITSLAFAYSYEERWKIYIPFAKNKKDKWLSNTKRDDTWYIDNESDTLIISKAAKDQKCIQSLLGDKYDYIHSQCENSIISAPRDYKRVIVLMDNDAAGVKAASLYRKKGYDVIFVPKEEDTSIKDFDSYYLKYGRLKAYLLLIRLIMEKRYIVIKPDGVFSLNEAINNYFRVDFSEERMIKVFEEMGFTWIDTLEDATNLLEEISNDEMDNVYFLWGTDKLNYWFAKHMYYHFVCIGDLDELVTSMKNFRGIDFKQYFKH